MSDSIKLKEVQAVFRGTETMDGAGVRLRRIFGGYSTASITDPFLLLDHFGSNKKEEYIQGFPWHPHRGIETITYLLDGKVEHEDSEGNRGTIYPNDLQWMSSGSGIYHQEMPKPIDMADPREAILSTGMPDSSVGLQLWLNIPAQKKMNKPAYRDIKGRTVGSIDNGEGARIKLIAGRYGKEESEFKGDPGIDPHYMDIILEPKSEFSYTVPIGYNSLLYLMTGSVTVIPQKTNFTMGEAIVFGMDGNTVKLVSGESGARFIFLAGRPLREPVHWYGPIVMNSQEQLNEAFRDLQNGTFIRDREPLFL